MSDLIESRISEIRPFAAADRIAQLEARIYQLNRFVSSARQSFNKKDPSILGEAIATLNDQNRCIAAGSPEGVRLIQSAHAPSDLEALLAEREGMKAEIERLNARLAWRDHRDSCHPCGSHVRAMCEQGVEIYSRTQSAAPLDPKRLRAGLNDDDRAFVEQTEKWSADAWKTSQADVRRLLAILARLSAPLDLPSETPEAPKDPIVQRALEMGLNTRVW